MRCYSWCHKTGIRRLDPTQTVEEGPSEEGENSHQPHLETQLVDNNKSKLFRVQGVDYPKLPLPTYIVHAHKEGGPDFAHTARPSWSQSG